MSERLRRVGRTAEVVVVVVDTLARALRASAIDAAVQSARDLPAMEEPGVCLAACPSAATPGTRW